ncbi:MULTISPECIES: glycosyltransferase family 2 protein [unclassified Actinoplanes]|uniref:glycosyltransferase family 2 protein n=1 Tax=unclassified Actinoplanes TaxID=2626549 RepID=UPI001E50EF16|nr:MULTISPECIES: glycosyltransferase family 2 protein [unclassified Actinoplanes]
MTITVWAGYIAYTIFEQFIVGKAYNARLGAEAIAYMLVITGLAASAIAYLITRIGYFYRGRGHQRAPRIMLDEFIGGKTPSLTVLVPSYQEDERTNRSTLLSAALQEYPGLRVTLLIDDPRAPKTRAARDMLLAARALPGKIEAELQVPYRRVAAAFAAFDEQVRFRGGHLVVPDDMRRLADEYRFASDWLYDLGARQEMVDHTDTFFVEHILHPLAVELGQIAGALVKGADEQVALPLPRMNQLHKRLLAIFDAQVTSFERKKYVSLSHEPNKAMNLNSYIGLMGGAYQEVNTPLGTALVTAGPNRADLVVPNPDYVLTLDADSVLLPEYALRLVHLMEQGAFAQHAVVQTPYSAYPGSGTRVERISGATTDIQYIVHQGMTHYGATFWVGANAVLRKKALDEICEVSYEGDWEIKRYIQDRTVIEDTESTIDLGVRGWTLHNYPERLAYSATPPDFGSLAIQRQRWANGGLLILSRLKDQFKAKSKREDKNRFGEYFLRVNYMASIFWSSMCLVIMLVYPFNNELLNPFLLLISVPYFFMMAADLKHLGYKRTDMLRIYGFNLILLPVNLSGSIASLLQLLTGEKSAFKRTPKVRNRTTTATSYLLLPLALVVLCLYTVWHDVRLHQWNNLVFAGLNLVLSLYAVIAFIGLGNTVVDLATHLRDWLVPVATPKKVRKSSASKKAAAPKAAAIGDWATVLHYRHETGATAGQVTVRLQRTDTGAWKTDRPTSASRAHLFEEFSFFTVFQPIHNMINGHVVGYEALTRFADGSNPREGLEAAAQRGVHVALDAALVQAAIASSSSLPNGTWLAVNVSTDLLRRPHELAPLLAEAKRPLIVEVGGPVPAEVGQLGGTVRLAVDDLGLGYETLALLESARPAFLKLSLDTVQNLENETARQASIRTLVEFAEQHGCTIIAEGIETAAQRDALVACGVPFGQGFYLGKPVPVERVLAGVGGW